MLKSIAFQQLYPNFADSREGWHCMPKAVNRHFANYGNIYVAYTYANETGDDVDRRTKITRFTYDPANGTISNPMDLISGLPLAGSLPRQHVPACQKHHCSNKPEPAEQPLPVHS
jgi:hypothetical protein